MPSVSGIQMSSRTRSGRCRSRNRRALPAFSASTTWWPSSARISESSSRMPTSSSTTRIWAISSRRLGQRQENAHRGATARAILDRDAAMVFVDDLLHDGQAEARAAGFGSHIGLKNSRHQLFGEPAAVVGNSEAHAVAGELGAHLDCRVGACGAGMVERVLCVLHQIVDHLAYLRAVGPRSEEHTSEL